MQLLHRLSLVVRQWLERLSIREVIGINLAGLAFFAAVVVPQGEELASLVGVILDTQQTLIEVVPTESKFRWPLFRFSLSQRFSWGHPGLDLIAAGGTPVYAISEGIVAWTMSLPWGYGKHLLINHEGTVKSLYAHLSTIAVKAGEAVTKETKIGEVGSTGWSTGNHLHLEIYQDGTPVNPLEVLPSLTMQ